VVQKHLLHERRGYITKGMLFLSLQFCLEMILKWAKETAMTNKK